MMDILNFTKQISGIESLGDYVVGYVNQNMILYSLLKNRQYTIVSANVDNSTKVVYDVAGISPEDMGVIENELSQQQISIYGHNYTVLAIPDSEDKLIITIE